LLSAAQDWPTPTANRSTWQESNGREYPTLPGLTERWPTPRAADGKVSGHPSGLKHRQEFGDTMLSDAAELWKTPDTPGGGRTLPPGTSPTGMTPDGKKAQVGLNNQAETWPTPKATQAGSLTRSGSGGPPQDLAVTAREWPTPKAEEHMDENIRGNLTLTGAAKAMGLDAFRSPEPGSPIGRPDPPSGNDGPRSSQSGPISRRHWPTPAALDAAGFPGRPDEGRTSPNSGKTLSGATEQEWQTPSANEFKWRRQAGQEERSEALLPAQAEMATEAATSLAPSRTTPSAEERPKMRLNVAFTEWLMGLPISWTDPMTPLDPATWEAWLESARCALTD
jgi:hypothetical protein